VLEFLEKHKKITVYFPLIVYWVALIIATSLPSKEMPNIKINDKIEHLLAYLVLSFLFNLTLLVQNKFQLLKNKAYISTIIFLGVYAMVDELHQAFIPGRDCSILDWSADIIGVFLGVSLTYFLVKKFK